MTAPIIALVSYSVGMKLMLVLGGILVGAVLVWSWTRRRRDDRLALEERAEGMHLRLLEGRHLKTLLELARAREELAAHGASPGAAASVIPPLPVVATALPAPELDMPALDWDRALFELRVDAANDIDDHSTERDAAWAHVLSPLPPLPFVTAPHPEPPSLAELRTRSWSAPLVPVPRS